VQDLALAALIGVALLVLDVFVLSSMVSEQTAVAARRRSLLVQLPWAIAIIGGGHAVLLLMLLHPASTVAVRLVAGLTLAAAAAWVFYLWGRAVSPRR
jgi:hypothetical protein